LSVSSFRLSFAPRPRPLPALAAAIAATLAVLPAASRSATPAAALATQLRALYADGSAPAGRWRRRATVRSSDGRLVPREEAFRDDPLFVAAARRLLASRAGDDAALGAWLLGTAAPSRRAEAAEALRATLRARDARVAFEATLALARLGGPEARPVADPASRAALAELARGSPSPVVRAAADWALGAPVRREPGLAPSFRRGVSWWMSERGQDEGAASFRRLASLGVDWVSIHTWDPLQRGLHDPVLAAPNGRFGIRDLRALVHNAHAAGLSVMVKPHLEMRWPEPSERDRQILRGTDESARRALFRRLEARFAGAASDHGRIEMQSEQDWRRWFAGYEAYLLPYARESREAGADLLCVGREMDLTVRLREADWRRLIARARGEFGGPLTYSANFDDWSAIGFWDALDFIGISAYFPLSDRADPALGELEAGWDRALAPVEEAHRRWHKAVLLTEVGYPSVPTAARTPWKEERMRADVWLQARCYEATLRALARRPWIEGAFFWLWERSSQPPFRDPSYAIPDKPASFEMARFFTR
jgi:hypothetical protein